MHSWVLGFKQIFIFIDACHSYWVFPHHVQVFSVIICHGVMHCPSMICCIWCGMCIKVVHWTLESCYIWRNVLNWSFLLLVVWGFALDLSQPSPIGGDRKLVVLIRLSFKICCKTLKLWSEQQKLHWKLSFQLLHKVCRSLHFLYNLLCCKFNFKLIKLSFQEKNQVMKS